MKNLLHVSLMLWLALSAAAQTPPAQPQQKTLHVYDWSELKPQPPGKVFLTNGVSVLKIENTNNSPLEVSLLTITDLSLIAKADSLSCEMKYVDVGEGLVPYTNDINIFGGKNIPVGESSIEIVNPAKLTLLQHCPPEVAGGDVITNESSHPLHGTSNWKPCSFSIYSTTGNLPTKLELKLSLPTNGTVYFRPLKLVGSVYSFGSWWSSQQAGLIGGIGGSLIGCLGGLIGLLVSKGKARNFVMAAVKCFIALGILLTITGLVTAVLKQPYAVWYALLFPGVILVLVFSINLHSIQRRYDELELRRMTSEDV